MITVEWRGYAGFFGRVDRQLVVAYCHTWTQAAAAGLAYRRRLAADQKGDAK